MTFLEFWVSALIGAAIGLLLPLTPDGRMAWPGRRRDAKVVDELPIKVPRAPPNDGSLARRMGRWRVRGEMLYGIIVDRGEGLAILDRMVVVRQEPDYCSSEWMIYALHPDFEPVAHGAIVPEYRAEWTDGDPVVRWRRVA